jgi:tight adherence protein B
MSAWVLTLIPFGLFVLLMVSSPDYLPILVKDPRGPYLIGGAFLMMVFGILWMRSIIRIEV